MTLKEMNTLRASPMEEQLHTATLGQLERMEQDALRLTDTPLRTALLEQLTRQKEETVLRLQQFHHRKALLETVLAAAPDDYLRSILQERYQQRLTWEEIALRSGGENACSAKKRVQRFLETLPSFSPRQNTPE